MISAELEEFGRFPRGRTDPETGAVIIRRWDAFVVSKSYEIGMLRFGPPKEREFKSLLKAARAYVEAEDPMGKGKSLDGVPIEWRE